MPSNDAPNLDEIAAMRNQALANMVPPQPVPCSITVQQKRLQDGTTMIEVAVSSPTGIFVYYLSPKSSIAVGSELKKLGSAGELLVAG